MRNSQLAILCATVIAGALIIAGSNWYLVRGLRSTDGPAASAAGQRAVTVAMMPKSKGDSIFYKLSRGS